MKDQGGLLAEKLQRWLTLHTTHSSRLPVLTNMLQRRYYTWNWLNSSHSQQWAERARVPSSMNLNTDGNVVLGLDLTNNSEALISKGKRLSRIWSFVCRETWTNLWNHPSASGIWVSSQESSCPEFTWLSRVRCSRIWTDFGAPRFRNRFRIHIVEASGSSHLEFSEFMSSEFLHWIVFTMRTWTCYRRQQAFGNSPSETLHHGLVACNTRRRAGDRRHEGALTPCLVIRPPPRHTPTRWARYGTT